MVKDERHEVVTIFNDAANMVRLVLKDPIGLCGHIVRPTNFDQLFVADAKSAPKVFRRELSVRDYSATLYANAQDAWLYAQLSESITKRWRELLHTRCKQGVEEGRRRYAALAAEQHSAIDGVTVALGHGEFATVTGEAWRRYRCRPIQVFGVDREKCYAGLPVRLSAEDDQRYRHLESILRGETVSHLEAFLEPVTRRITTIPVEVNCSVHFSPVYENIHGRWVTATPSLFPAATPMELDAPQLTDATPAWDSVGPDFEAGGVYPLDGLLAMDAHNSFPRLKNAVLYTTAQAMQQAGGRYSAGHALLASSGVDQQFHYIVVLRLDRILLNIHVRDGRIVLSRHDDPVDCAVYLSPRVPSPRRNYGIRTILARTLAAYRGSIPRPVPP